MSSHGAEQLIVQRVARVQTVADGRKALVSERGAYLPGFFSIFLLVGAMLWFFTTRPLSENCHSRVAPGCHGQCFIFPIFMITEVRTC